MRSGMKSSNEKKDFAEEDQGPNQSNRSAKSSDSKTTATRSKHSITEQRRRSKINERFQRLRGLLPNSDEKKDTASFLLEVIDYVQYLQGEVQKYEGPYQQPWGSEPTKLMPWRNSHLRTQSIASQQIGNGVGTGYVPKFIDPSQSLLIGHPHEFGEPDVLTDATDKSMDQQINLANSEMSMPMQDFSHASQNTSLVSRQPLSDSQSVEPSLIPGTLSQPDGLVIEEGTISVSSAYSQGLLHTLTDTLQRAGVDLSQANISVQIDLGKRANRGPVTVEEYNNMASTHPHPTSTEKT